MYPGCVRDSGANHSAVGLGEPSVADGVAAAWFGNVGTRNASVFIGPGRDGRHPGNASDSGGAVPPGSVTRDSCHVGD